ncbi:hypothetical protein A9Q81_12165 [Gammaproteobacteria bacterium 42_54_T18]|nr:hypothetical protein A9Q81_12165 [Gammaproteobacteria bacterium 42_54_T18]
MNQPQTIDPTKSTLSITPSRWREPKTSKDPSLNLLLKLVGKPKDGGQAIETRLKKALMEGDPLADTVVLWMHTLPTGEGRKLFEQALESGIQSIKSPPQPLVDLFKQLDDRPTWVDDEALTLACKTGLRAGLGGQLVLSCMALMGGYRSGAAVKPLVMTGALTSMAKRRLAETSRFVVDLYNSPTLSRNSAGFKSAVRVRLMHALVRHRLANNPQWKNDAWGTPINQADMLGTNLLFSVASLLGLRSLGFIYNKKESQATITFWRYVGYLMGVDPDLLPKTLKEGMRTAYFIGASQGNADNDSRELAEALMEIPYKEKRGSKRWLGKMEMQFRSGLSRLFMGDSSANELGLPNTPLKFTTLLTMPFVLTGEMVRILLPGGNIIAERIGRYVVHRHVESILGGKLPDYVPYHEKQ